MSSDKWIGLIGLGMGLCSFLSGVILWWKGSIEKRYAAERDFHHLRNNYQQIAANLDVMAEESERNHQHLMTELVQVKSLLMAVLAKSGDSISGIMRGS